VAANGNALGQGADAPSKGQAPRGDRPPRQRGTSSPADDVFFNQDED
jgi:hypothetical protein